MNARHFRNVLTAALLLVPGLAAAVALDAGAATDFDGLLHAGFKEVRDAAAASGVPAPDSKAAVGPALNQSGGVFLHSDLDGGALSYCAAAGCRSLLSDGASLIVLAGPGALYFTGAKGTGYCTERECDLLLPGVRLTFPLTSGPNGDIYGSDQNAGYRCTPALCARASDVPLQRYNNYIDGAYRPNGDFLSSSADGTFWCSAGACRRVGDGEMLLIEDNCAGTPPADAFFGFWGSEVLRCAKAGCREIANADHVDNFVECAFDAAGRLHLPRRDDQGRAVGGSLMCGETSCSVDARRIVDVAAPAKPAPLRSSEFFETGDDGAEYRLAGHAADSDPAPQAPKRRPAAIARVDNAGRTQILPFDVPMDCWNWFPGDEEDAMAPAWENHCRVIR